MKDKAKDTPYCGASEAKIRAAKPKLHRKNWEHLLNFITERYSIYKKREQDLPAPWTEDEVLQHYKFTNVRREHDRTTIWVIKNIINNPKLSYEDKLIRTVMFRLYNKMETASGIGMHEPTFSIEDMESMLYDFPEGYVYYTDAFYTSGTKMGIRMDFPDRSMPVMPLLFGKRMRDEEDVLRQVEHWTTPEDAIRWLRKHRGIGEFISYQIWVDWTYIKEFPFSENHYVLAGPGCKRGLKTIIIDPDGMNWSEQMFWLRDNIERIFKKIDSTFDVDELFDNLPEHDRVLNVMSLENCMCELSKYIRAVNGTGRPRVKYKPRRKSI